MANLNRQDDIPKKTSGFRKRLFEIIFEADTREGKAFDVWLLGMILSSITVVILESIPALHSRYLKAFIILEWFFTLSFTIEYFFRIYVVKRPLKYMLSFYGIIDLLAIVPTYLSLIIYGTQYMVVIRALRLLRVFRIFKLVHFVKEGYVLVRAIKSSAAKISVFLLFVLVLSTIMGALMYAIEGEYNERFTSIPAGIYWAIVTLTTVGYGDLVPVTALGQFISILVMILGYSVIAVPTGIISAEMARPKKVPVNTQACPGCGNQDHDEDAVFCKRCGTILNEK